MGGQRIHHKVNRNLKHIPIMARISATGESLTPYTLTSQDTPSARKQLKKHGVGFGAGFSVKLRAKPSINAKIFAEYIHTVSLPNLNELRTLGEFADE
jgi:hypothetical protein